MSIQPLKPFGLVTTMADDDLFGLSISPGVGEHIRGMTKANVKFALNIPRGRILAVDQIYGSDSLGGRTNAIPFLTLTAAKNAAVAGDLVRVYPGTYNEHDIGKTGVNWDFAAGATVTWTTSTTVASGYAIFDDHAGALVCDVRGSGDFTVVMDHAPSMSGGIVALANGSSDVAFQGQHLSITGGANQANSAVSNIGGGRLLVEFETMIDPQYGVTQVFLDEDGNPFNYISSANGIYWENGETYVRGKLAKLNQSFLWSNQPASHPDTNLYVDVQHIQANWNATIYVTSSLGDGGNFKTWVNCLQVLNSGNGCIYMHGGGKLYVNAQKVTATGAAVPCVAMNGSVSPYAPKLWLTAQKLTSAFKWLDGNASFAGATKISCLEFEDTTGIAVGFEFPAGSTGTTILHGGAAKVLNGLCLNHAGGTVRVKEMLIDTSNTNTAANTPVAVKTSGIILSRCTLLAPAASKCARVPTTAITAATNATPIVITAAGHGLTTGDTVTIAGVGGNTAANGDFVVTVVNANTFSLNTSVGNGVYTSGGTVSKHYTIKNYGSVANVAVDTSLTVQVQAILVDANVT